MGVREYGRTIGHAWIFDNIDCDSLNEAMRLAREDAAKDGIRPTSFILTEGPRPWVLTVSWYARVEEEDQVPRAQSREIEAQNDADSLTAPAEPGMVRFRFEMVPSDVGNDGEAYHAGTLPPHRVAAILHDLATEVTYYSGSEKGTQEAR